MRTLKKVLALALALVMSLSLVTITNAVDFSDAADIDYSEAGVEQSSFNNVAATRRSAPAIEYCVSLGIIDGAGDGNFCPAGKLTGYAFAKMPLTAIGYDSQREGYTGASRSINVATVAMEAGLHDGLEKMFGSAELSRQKAAQMALNAIKTPSCHL